MNADWKKDSHSGSFIKVDFLYKSSSHEKKKKKEMKEIVKFGAICENCMFGLNLFGNTLNSDSRMMFKALEGEGLEEDFH